MVNVPEELKEYFYKFYEVNSQYDIPKNINVYLLEKKEFKKAIKLKETEVFRIKKPIIEESLNGLIIVDTKNKYRYTYHIYILKENTKVTPYTISVLFHELAHAHTLPIIEISDLKEYDEKGHFSYIGYEIWREFIANYIGDDTFLRACGNINYVFDKNKLIKLCTKILKEVKEDKNYINLDEILAFMILSDFNILEDISKIICDTDYKVFMMLLETCKNYLNIKEYQNITKRQLNEIGQLINMLIA